MATKSSCPICGKPSHKEALPFCSARCADIDLGRWAAGAYAVPVVEDDEPEDGDVAAEG